MTQHPTYDEFWQARDLRRHLKNIKPAVMTVGGWFDAEDLFGALDTYQAIEKNSPGAHNMLVMGPWFHGGWSRSDGDTLGQRQVRLQDRRVLPRRDRVSVLQSLAEGQGRSQAARGLRLRDRHQPVAARGRLAAEGRAAEDALPPCRRQARASTPPHGAGAPFDEYVSDPNKPVPYIDGQSPGMTREHMMEDQRFASHAPRRAHVSDRRARRTT